MTTPNETQNDGTDEDAQRIAARFVELYFREDGVARFPQLQGMVTAAIVEATSAQQSTISALRAAIAQASHSEATASCALDGETVVIPSRPLCLNGQPAATDADIAGMMADALDEDPEVSMRGVTHLMALLRERDAALAELVKENEALKQKYVGHCAVVGIHPFEEGFDLMERGCARIQSLTRANQELAAATDAKEMK